VRNNLFKLLSGKNMVLVVVETAKKRVGKTAAIRNNNRVSMTDEKRIS
jgi:hypothetical protein